MAGPPSTRRSAGRTSASPPPTSRWSSTPTSQEAQAAEFLAGPAKTGGRVIATGDFNSAADPATTDTPTTTYADLTKSWFKDAWAVNDGDPGLTCCQNGTLTNPVSALHTRIDLVLTHGAVKAKSAEVVGDQPIGATPPFWASDHAGVVATLNLSGHHDGHYPVR